MMNGSIEVGDRHILTVVRFKVRTFQLFFNHGGEGAEHIQVFLAELSWLVVNDAQTANFVSAGFTHRHAGVKTNVWATQHKRVRAKTRVPGRIFYNKNLILSYGILAERHRTGYFRYV